MVDNTLSMSRIFFFSFWLYRKIYHFNKNKKDEKKIFTPLLYNFIWICQWNYHIDFSCFFFGKKEENFVVDDLLWLIKENEWIAFRSFFVYYIKGKYCSRFFFFFWVCLCFIDRLKNKWRIAWLRSLLKNKDREREKTNGWRGKRRRFLHYDYSLFLFIELVFSSFSLKLFVR